MIQSGHLAALAAVVFACMYAAAPPAAKPSEPAATAAPAAERQPAPVSAPQPAPVPKPEPAPATKPEPAPAARPEPPPHRPERPESGLHRSESRGALPGADAKLRFNFRFQPWKDVLDWFAQQAGLSLVLDAPPPGTFNYTDDRDYTPAQAIDLLNSVLLTKGYTLVRRDRMLMLINLQDGIPANLVSVIPAEELDKRGEYELVSVLFNIERLSPEEADAEVKKLLGPQGSVVVLASARQLLVTDIAGRLRAVRAMLERVDKSDGNSSSQMRTFDLKQAVPQTVLDLLRQLLDIPTDRMATADGSVRLALDTTNQRLLVSGKPERLARVEEVLRAINVREVGKVDAAAPPLTVNTPQLQVYNIASADPEAALNVLQTLMNGLPEVRLALDAKNSNLIVFARPEQQATIQATLEQLQREARKIEVIVLRRVDPQAAVTAITKLFAADAGKAAPQVDADPTTRQLLIRASSAQIEQIRTLLGKLGENPAELGGGGTVRMLPLTGPGARAALERIQEIWPMLHESRIRVVNPSSVFPAVRTGAEGTTPAEKPRPDEESLRDPPGGRHMRHPLGPPAASVEPRTPPAVPSHAAPPPQMPPAQAAPAQPPVAPTVPAAPAVKTSPKDKAAHWSSARMILVGQAAATPEAKPVVKPEPKPEAPPAATPQPTPGPPPAAPMPEPATIFVLPGPGGMVITSQDQQALDQFEDLFRSLAGTPSKSAEFTIFYLKHTKAAAVGETLDGIFGGGTLSAEDSRSNGRGMGGGDSLFGGAIGSGSSTSTGTLRITPDSRLNALIVQGSPQDLDKIEQLLRVLDQQESPEEVAVAPKPRMIPVYNTQASEVADIVKQIYADRIGSSSSPSQQRGSRVFEMLAMMRGPGGMMGGPPGMMGGLPGMMGSRNGMMGGSQASRRGTFPGSSRSSADDGPRMTIGVDSRSNNLIVVAPETLFEEVKQLVEDIDRSAGESTQAVKIVTLERTSVPALQAALSALTGGSTTTSTSSAGATGQPGVMAGMNTQRGGYIAPAPQSTTQSTASLGRPGSFGGAAGGPPNVTVATGQQSASFGRGFGGALGAQQQGRTTAASRRANTARGNQTSNARTTQAYGNTRVSSASGGATAQGGFGGSGNNRRSGFGSTGGMSGGTSGGTRGSTSSGARGVGAY
jgi:type II secretory pathway component GspD/PulD (secretin)